jgi:thioredoxin reductase
LHLAKYARSVTLLVRGESLAKSMSSYLISAIPSTRNIAARLHTEVVEGGGDEVLEYLQLTDHANGISEAVPAAALFVMIGGEPHTRWLPDEIAHYRHGYLITGRDLLHQPEVHWTADREPFTLETSMPGVFAAGDARHGSIKRIASAVGDNATRSAWCTSTCASTGPRPRRNSGRPPGSELTRPRSPSDRGAELKIPAFLARTGSLGQLSNSESWVRKISA